MTRQAIIAGSMLQKKTHIVLRSYIIRSKEVANINQKRKQQQHLLNILNCTG